MRRKRNKPNKNVIFALCKKKSMISSNAIQYTLSHLLKVAFPMPEPPGFVFEVAENSVTVTLAEHLKLRMAQFSNEETALFCNGNAQRLLHHIRSADELADIPVFQPVACTLSRPVLNENGELEIPYDFTTPSFFLLSRAEEHNGQPRDSHDRFRYEESLAHHYGFIHLPLVDEYALLLRKWLMEILKTNSSPRTTSTCSTASSFLGRPSNPLWDAICYWNTTGDLPCIPSMNTANGVLTTAKIRTSPPFWN